MTKAESIQAMKEGKKVTHRYFSLDEWATMVNNLIILEDGVRCTPEEFWRWRNNPIFDTDWSIYVETETSIKKENEFMMGL
jgi:hypothetical protein